jgi:transposase InsO family protein/transposase-like protein
MWFNKKTKRKYTRKTTGPGKIYSKEEKLKYLKEFEAVGAPVAMFCKWYGIGLGTFKNWQDRYRAQGEDGLEDNRGGREATEVPEAVKEEIVKLKVENPHIGMGKISEYLTRHKFVKLCSEKIRQVLQGNSQTAGLIEQRRIRHGNSGKEPQRFERSKPGELYQMDIMTFPLRGLYKLYVIACLDDYSRFVVSIGVFRSQTADRVLDVLKGAIERYGMPNEILTDNGRQFYTWRGKSEFQKYLIKSGIRHIRSRPYNPQTCGKVESLWRNMYQELLSKEPIASFEEMEEKVTKWIEWYNFKRPHQGIDGLVPADRFFSVEGGVREMMEKGASMVKDALIVDPRKIKKPMYLIGRIGGKEIRVIAKEGSVMVEGLDEVEQKDGTEVPDGRGKEGIEPGNSTAATAGVAGAETAGDKPGAETGERIAGDIEEKEGAGSGAGAWREPGSGAGMEEQGSGGHGEGPGGQGTGPETEELREGRRSEGQSGGYPGETEGVGEGESASGGREEERGERDVDGQAGHWFY